MSTAVPTQSLPEPISHENMEWYKSEFKLSSDLNLNSYVQAWQDIEIGLEFEYKMKDLIYFTCDTCNEKQLKMKTSKQVCSHSDQCLYYSDINNMDPGPVPEVLSDLTFIEEQLIARVHPLVSVFRLKGGQFGYQGNVISFFQNVQAFADQLPHKISDLKSIIVVKFKNKTDKYHDFRVRARKIYNALDWLIKNNIYYKNVTLSIDNMNALPEDENMYDSFDSLSVNDDENTDNSDNEDNHLDDNNAPPGKLHFSGIPPTTLPHQDEQIEASLQWPTLDDTPVNEFTTPGYIACAFPCLFPTGIADLRDSRSKKMTPSNYFKHLMHYKDNRFARHKTFRFFCLNTLMRWTALTDGNIFIRNNPEFKNMTAQKLKKLLKENPNLIRKVMFQASNIRGTKPYWRARCMEVREMVQQVGLPTIFLTLSFPDHHIQDLYRLLSDKDPSTLTESERYKLLQENPAIVDLFFKQRIDVFLSQIKKKYRITDFWYRIEYQNRGSPHMHGLFWFADAPVTTDLVNASEEHKNEVLAYFDNLIYAMNPDASFHIRPTHPSRLLYQDVVNHEEDYACLLNTVQRHTYCSKDYCLRFNKQKKRVQCRFNFPQQLEEKSKFEIDENGLLQYVPARNDELMNKHNKFMMEFWRGNMDVAPVLSKEALISYLVKYIAKSEVASSAMDELSQILQTYDNTDQVKSALQKLFIKICAERDFSAQEVCHLLLGLNLYSSGGREFVYVYTKKSKEWIELPNDHSTAASAMHQTQNSSFMDKYKNRPVNMEDITLWEAATEYDTAKWKKKQRKKIAVVFPRYGASHKQNLSEHFCEQQLILHRPWRTQRDLKTETQTWKESYMSSSLHDPACLSIDLNTAHRNDQEYLSDSDSDSSVSPEEWMLLSGLGPKTNIPQTELGKREVDLAYDWKCSAANYRQYGSIAEIQSFIASKKKEHSTGINQVESDLTKVQLNDDQQSIVDLLRLQIKTIKDNDIDLYKTIPKRVIIQGKAGTGKSFIIQIITTIILQELGSNALLKATPTGVSALAIRGQTAYTALSIPVDEKKFEQLRGEAARNFSNKLGNTKFLIIDEFSMLGSSLFGRIELRCKEITQNKEEDFGGLFVYMFGDVCQLPPVLDTPLYKCSQKSGYRVHGKRVFDGFDGAFVLSKSIRQASTTFVDILDRLGKGTNTPEDYQVFKLRFTTNVSEEDCKSFKDTIRLYPKIETVTEYNMSVLSKLIDPVTKQPIPVAVIPSKNNSKKAKKASSNLADGLETKLYLAKGCKVILRRNVWTAHGLVNGALGHVIDLLYNECDSYPTNPPSVILCDFPSYTGPPFIQGTTIVPISPVTKSWDATDGKNCSRSQFPLQLCYACSIHKSQGLTLEKAVVDLGQSEFSLGLAYVVMSRVKTLKGLLIQPFCYDRISSLANHDSMYYRIAFQNDLQKLSDKTKLFLSLYNTQ